MVPLTVCYYHVTWMSKNSCLKQAPNLKFKWGQRDWNLALLISKNNIKAFSQIDRMIELCCEYLSAWWIWMYVLMVSRTSFCVSAHFIVCLNVKKLLTRRRRHIWSLSKSKETGTHNKLVCERTLKNLAQLAKWFSCVVSTFLYSAFDCMSVCY